MLETARTNAAMRDLLARDLLDRRLPLRNKTLRGHLDQGLLEQDDCVLLKALAGKSTPYDPQRFQDRTGYECSINHLQIEADGPDGLFDSLAFAQRLAALLAGSAGAFTIVISCDLETGESNLRFHRLRPGESWLKDDLESYPSQAILAIKAADLVRGRA